MSHHLDSPLARSDVRLDITDFYVFRGETGTVFAINVSPSIAGEDAPRGFHPEGRYEFRIDGNSDLVPELTYRISFGDEDGSGGQGVELRRLRGADAVDAAADGTVLATGTTGTMIPGEGGLRLWAGRAHDPFFLDGVVLGAVGNAFAQGTVVDLSGWSPATATNAPFGSNDVYALVLEVPDPDLLEVASDRRIGTWALSMLATDAGGWRPINRVGLPMIPPIFAQHDEHLGDHLNTADPAEDRSLFADRIASAVAAVVKSYGTADDPRDYGRTVADRIFPNVLPYTVGTPAVFGFGGWNGRSLTDSAPDVMFSLATNTAFTTGVTKDSVPVKPTATFPYVPVFS
ncbi:DUF4331 domain-containing protein [Streptacidiphilus sp. ASG 303]|uniref:DUF4331 family protein n=1 Tax=Streptacidiphilus sp. ASG 303 TaxID=2896847 RepID=UPI001E608457|nr:DUF4331 family protein [Streptacidiphilus sp. ASG 303]MCD0484057.1 DUF4331 domain-containing protein [Streptacidiphilus sp. ASG 303]